MSPHGAGLLGVAPSWHTVNHIGFSIVEMFLRRAGIISVAASCHTMTHIRSCSVDLLLANM